jgi:predicted nucleic acid-binding protein
MYTVDTSVWVNGFDHREAGHAVSRQLLEHLGIQALPIVVPTLLLVEVAGAISRTRQDVVQAQAFATALSQLPNVTFVALDKALARHALALAAQHQLRGADAVYAAVALNASCTLISLDKEHLTRLNRIVTVQTPAEVLSDLAPPEHQEQEGG